MNVNFINVHVLNSTVSSSSAYAGGFLATANGCVFRNCTLQNTCVTGSVAGGFAANFAPGSRTGVMDNCFNLGFQDASQKIVISTTGTNDVGGLVGMLTSGNITNSGVFSGQITSVTGNAGGIAGCAGSSSFISSVFVRPQVNVIGKCAGGKKT